MSFMAQNSKHATITAQTADDTTSHALERLRTGWELTRLRWVERARRSVPLWEVLLAVARWLRLVGTPGLRARVVQTGQRSCPYAPLRTEFGRLAQPLMPVLSRSPWGWLDVKRTGTNRVSVLKPYVGPGERGVIHLKFSEVISAFPKSADMACISKYYRLVLEPSWTGLCDPGILQYARHAPGTIVMAPDSTDYEFLAGLDGKLVPVNLGPCDWVDPRVPESYLGSRKAYDIVVNANWAAWKRHQVLFAALRELPRTLKVALIGGSLDGGTLERIFRIARYYGVEKQLIAFQFIPFTEVMRVVSSSRCAVLLSLKEGANRALSEAMFCDVPVLLLDEHVGGIRKNVVPETGVIAPERELAGALDRLLSSALGLHPRAWAMSNISCVVSTGVLEARVREVALRDGEEWTSGIVVRANSPETKYYDSADEARLHPYNEALIGYLRKQRRLPIPD
jgi:Glycosyl transferases group 1